MRRAIFNAGEKAPQNIRIILSNGAIEERDGQFNLLKTIQTVPLSLGHIFNLDIDQNESDEFIVLTKDRNQLLIADEDFSNPILTNIEDTDAIYRASLILNRNEHPRLFISGINDSYIFLYQKNYLYYLRYPLYLSIFLGLLLILMALQKIQKYQSERKYAAEKKVAELQILAINNQLNPHFTFNILNSIGNLFQQQDSEKADYIFGKYSKLLSKTILNSDKIRTTIGEEIEYVKNYLDLEKFRLSNTLKYEILRCESVDSGMLIPKMLIYTFVENAIKHGIRHLSGEGIIKIQISRNEEDYTILISDNGIGREMAGKTAVFSTGKGLKILDQILDLYQNLAAIKITYSLRDLYDSQNNPSGTEVIINVPLSK